MKTWLHFIGRQYYTQAKFIKEAKRYGITRRVSLQQLKRMAYGDRVLLAIMEGKSPVVFGSFVIDKISGLSPAASAAVQKGFECEIVSAGGGIVTRGCGMYIEGACLAVKANLREIVEILEELKENGEDIGKLMIGGKFENHSLVRLKDIPFRMGFREFNYEKFCNAVAVSNQEKKSGEIIAVHGQFYVDKGANGTASEEPIEEGLVEEVKDYKRKGA